MGSGHDPVFNFAITHCRRRSRAGFSDNRSLCVYEMRGDSGDAGLGNHLDSRRDGAKASALPLAEQRVAVMDICPARAETGDRYRYCELPGMAFAAGDFFSRLFGT